MARLTWALCVALALTTLALVLADAADAVTWTAVNAPLAGLNASANPFAALVAESCPAAGWCVAVGEYSDVGGARQGLIETVDAGVVTPTAAPLAGLSPAAGPNPQVSLQNVSCGAEGSCVATGQYTDSAGKLHLLAEVLADGTWSAKTLPIAGLDPAPDPSSVSAGINAITCPTAGWCAAVGQYGSNGLSEQPLTERLVNGIWTARTAPVSTLSPAGSTGALLDVSCAHAGACVAVGNTDGGEGDLAATFSGGAWTTSTPPFDGISPSPALSPFSHLPAGTLSNVSCNASFACDAVGVYFDMTSAQQGMLVSIGGSGTRGIDLTHLTPPGGSNPIVLWSGIQCTTNCTGIGGYTTPASGREGLAINRTGQTKTSVKGLKPPSGNPHGVTFNRMSCPSAANCVAVGQYADDNSFAQAIVETMSGLKSSATTLSLTGVSPAPKTAAQPTLTSVSCPVSGQCLAVGNYLDASNNFDPILTSPGPAVFGVAKNMGPLAGGNTVTITGAGFAADDTVTFGSASSASVTLVNATHLKAVVPAGSAGTVDVRVSDSSGEGSIDTAADHYTYLPPPTITAISPGAGPTAGGTAVTITGTNFAPGSIVHFGSANVTPVSFVSSTTLDVTAPAGVAGTVRVTVITPGGHSGGSPAAFYVYGPPTVTSLSPNTGHPHGGNVVIVGGAGFAADATVSFGSVPASSVEYLPPARLKVRAPAHTVGTVDVTVTTNSGTSAISSHDKYTYAPA